MLIVSGGLSFASEPLLGGAQHGTLVKVKGVIQFQLDDKRNKEREKNHGLDFLKQWLVIGCKIQATLPHRPDDKILIGGVGHFNVGMLKPYSGICIFIAVGQERPKLAGITDANGRFAISLPKIEAEKELFLYFSETIDSIEISYPKNMIGLNLSSGKERDYSKLAFLALGSTAERYLVNTAEQDGAGQPATAPQSKSKGNKNTKQESKGRSQ